MVLSLTEARSIAPDEVVLSAQDATSILIPSDTLLFSADFVRDGGDLVLINDDSAPIRIVGYFTQDDLPTLTVPNGAALQGHVIDVLAGPQAPFQFAQAGGGVTNPANAIGQVEEVTGDATVQRADGTTVPLQLGMKVFANDVVSTGSDSSLSLTFVDGTIFTLAASSRMVLDSLIYDPNATDNSGVFNLVEGTFVFIAGQVAKTGGFEVVTPAATMGIRGTTVVVEIRSENGQTVVEVSLDADPNGDTGEFTITGLDGTLIANVDSTDTKWVISPLDNVAEQVERTAEDLLEAEFLIQRSYSSFEQATTRVDNGGEFVEPTDSTPNQQPTDEQNNDNINTDSDTDQQFDEPPEGDEAPIDLQPEGSDGTGGDEASLGSGAQTDFTIDSPAATNTSETTSVAVANPDTGAGASSAPQPTVPTGGNTGGGGGGAPPPNVSPTIDIAGFNATNATVAEDGSTTLSGFNISDPENGTLTVTLVAGSTITLAPGSGVTIIEGIGVEDVRTVITGRATQINNALNGLVYMPSDDADDQGTLTITVSDGVSTVDATAVIEIIPVQDPPVAVNDEINLGEDATAFTGNVLLNDSDPDVTPTPDVLSVQAISQGVLAFPLGTPITLAGGGTLVMQADGSYSFDPNGAYASLAPGATTTETVTVTVNDGNGNTATSQLIITIEGSDSAPIIVSEIETAPEVGAINGNVLSNDVDPEGEPLTVLSASQNGNAITLGVAFTTSGGGLLTINADGTFTFDAAGNYDALSPGQIVTENIQYSVSDGVNPSESATLSIEVTGSNDAPELTVSGTQSYAEQPDSGPIAEVAVGANATITDIDSANLTGATISITSGFQTNEDQLNFVDVNGITGSYNPATGVLTLSGTSSVANYQAALQSITFSNASQDISEAQREISFSVTDGTDTSAVGTTTINVTASNDAPTITGVPTTFNVTEDVDANLDLSGITIADVDAGTGDLSVTISVTQGTIDVPTPSFRTDLIISSVGSSVTDFTITGSAADINTYLDSMFTYTPALDFNGQAQLSLTLSDNGNSGGPAETVTAGSTIEVAPVNDAPTITGVPATLSVVEDSVTNIDLSAITIADVDAGSGNLTVTIAVTEGTLLGPGGLSFTTSSVAVPVSPPAVSFTGTAAEINAYLDSIFTYTPPLNFNGPAQLSVTVSDNGNTGGPAQTVTIDTTIEVSPVNDAPTITGVPATLNVVEDVDASLDFSGITVADVDAGSGSLSLKISVNNGQIDVPLDVTSGLGISGAVFGGAASEFTITGSAADLNTYLAEEFGYTPPPNFNGDAQLNFSLLDNGNSGGTQQTVTAGSTIAVSPVNDAPTITGLPATFSVTEDVDANLDLSGVSVADVDAGTGNLSLTITVSNGSIDVPLDTTSGLSISGATFGGSASSFEITGSAADITTYLDSAFNYSPPVNFNGVAQIGLSLSDNGNSGGPAQIISAGSTIDISPANDAPVLTTDDTDDKFVEGGGPVDTNKSTTLSDVDSATLESATITISNNFQMGDTLIFTDTAAISGSYDAHTGELTLTGTASVADYQAALLSIQFEHQGDAPNENFRTISFQVSDGTSSSTIENTFLDVVATNDAPTITGVPSTFNVVEDVDTNLDLSGVTVEDVDAGAGDLSLTVSVTNGVVDVPINSNASLTVTGVNAAGESANFTLTGSAADISAYLDGNFTFEPDQNFNGNAQLAFSLTDNGNSGGAAQTVTDGATIEVSPVNDAPTITGVPSTCNVNEDIDAALDLSGVEVADVDAGAGNLSLTISVTDGSIFVPLDSTAGLSITGTVFGGIASSFTVTGSAADITSYLDSTFNYSSPLNFNGQTQLNLSLTDNGNSGGAAQTATAGSTIDVSAVNDPPVFRQFTASYTVVEDTPTVLDLSGVELFDIDVDGGKVELTIGISGGPGGLAFTAPTGTGLVLNGNVLTGSIAEINAYLAGGNVTFTPAADFNDGNANGQQPRISFTIDDLGNTGSGGNQSTTGFANINVTAVNDAPVIDTFIGSGPELITNGGFEQGPDVAPLQVINAGSTALVGWSIDSGSVDQLTGTNTGFLAPAAGDNVLDLHGDGPGVISQTISTEAGRTYELTFLIGDDQLAGELTKDVRVTIDGQDYDFSANTVANGGYQPITLTFVAETDATTLTFSSLDAPSPSGPFLDEVSVKEVITDSYSALEEVPIGIENLIFSDVDGASDTQTVTFSVNDGILTIRTDVLGGVTASQLTGNGTNTVEYTGPLGALNATLYSPNTGASFTADNGLVYQGDAGFSGTDTLTVTINDNGNTGGAAESDSETFSIVVKDVPDTTAINVTSLSRSATEDTALNVDGISIETDETGNVTVTLAAEKGIITVADDIPAALTPMQIADNGSYSVTLTGTAAQINATLGAAGAVQYLGNLNFNGGDAITVTLDDGVTTTTETVSVAVAAVSDAPPHDVSVGAVASGSTALEGVQFTGSATLDRFGGAISGIGDFNNDGIDDFAISATTSTSEQPGATASTGSLYVIFGSEGVNPFAAAANANGEINIDTFVANGGGFELVGVNTDDSSTTFITGDIDTISGGGDFNNDGIDDFVFGVSGSDSPTNSGSAYVVYGGQNFASFVDASTGEISLSTVGTVGGLAGFEVRDNFTLGGLGASVALGGDVNNDGIADLLIGRYSTSSNGSAWLIIGGQDLSSDITTTDGVLALSSLSPGTEAYRFVGDFNGDIAGAQVEFLGDFNGDGIDDFVISSPGNGSGGAIYVIYGGQDWEDIASASVSNRDISLGDLGTIVGSTLFEGFVIDGPGIGNENTIGYSLSNAGDVNNDGFADLLFTDRAFNDFGETYLIYGGQFIQGSITPFSISSGAVDGAVFAAANFNNDTTTSGTAGDINGDGFSDILLGDSSAGSIAGAAYVIYGQDTQFSGTSFTVAGINGSNGFQLNGESPNEFFGGTIASVGDVNNDGFDDFIASAVGNGDGAPGGQLEGAAYLIYGGDFQNSIDLVAGSNVTTGTSAAEVIAGTPLNDVIDGGGGADHINAGGGDDVITIEGSTFASVDGGSGDDTLILSDGGSFDLTEIGDTLIESIEVIDVADNGHQDIIALSVQDVFNISDNTSDALEALFGGAPFVPNGLIIDAAPDELDQVQLYDFDDWNLSASGVGGYNIYQYVEPGGSDVLATLAVTDDVAVISVPLV